MAKFTVTVEIGNATRKDAESLQDSFRRYADVYLAERTKNQGLNWEHPEAPYVGRCRVFSHSE